MRHCLAQLGIAQAMAWTVAACAPPVEVLSGGGGTTVVLEGSGDGASVAAGSTSIQLTSGDPTCDSETGCTSKVDLLFVIDNSGTMGEEQRSLAQNFPLLIQRLEELQDENGFPVPVDVNILVTTTDFGNPECDGFLHPDYQPAAGAPIHTPCTERLNRFTSLSVPPVVIEEACTDACDPLAPARPTDQFIHFDRHGHNVMGGDPTQALACIGPQGVDGCGFEAPLESMLQALRPAACWNNPQGCEGAQWDFVTKPFLRDGAVLAIAIITDEADCSVRDYTIMNDPTFMETHAETMEQTTTSAVCWNAGVVCSDLNPGTGVYSGCVAANRDKSGTVGAPDEAAVLHPLSRYVDFLKNDLGAQREVIMLGVLGVPEVTRHASVAPFNPIEGGIEALEYRLWRDGEYPPGDILPPEFAEGLDAADKQFEFGIGPGCTAYDADPGGPNGQAIPPARVRQVCESLNEEGRVRCCIESICDDDFSPAIRCLTGLIQGVIDPEQ